MEMRRAKIEDLKVLKEVWKLCFGDEDSFIDLYFQSRDWLNETAVLLLDGRIVSMLTMMPVDMIGETGESCKASMLYAIATHPDFRKRGLAAFLIDYSNQYQLSQQVPVTLLVPAGEELFRFYAKCGYTDGFFVREAVLNRNEIETLAGRVTLDCSVTSIEASGYNQLRRKLLKGHPYLNYRDDEVSFEKQLGRIYDADLLAIEINGTEGCAYFERISREQVIIKELLVPEKYLTVALMQISVLVPGDKYIVRTPPHSGETLGGAVRHFGMVRINGADSKRGMIDPCTVSADSYLGIAYD